MGTASSTYRTSDPDVTRCLPRHSSPDGQAGAGTGGGIATGVSAAVRPALATGGRPALATGGRSAWTSGGAVPVIPAPRSPGRPASAGARTGIPAVPAPATPGVRVLADPAIDGWAAPIDPSARPTGDSAGAVLPRRLLRGPDRMGSHRAPRSAVRRHGGALLVAVVLLAVGVLALWA